MGGLALLLAGLIVFTLVSPLPVALLIRAAFRKSPAVPPEGYTAALSRITVVKDLSYPSAYPDNTVDLYLPAGKGATKAIMPPLQKDVVELPVGEGTFPIVLWIHGGAFVGGDKSDVQYYAAALAAEGYAVACMNYCRAPEEKYPAPHEQTQEALRWLAGIADSYALDMERFVLAGDSAGAHVAAQFAAMQSNPAYAIEMGFASAGGVVGTQTKDSAGVSAKAQFVATQSNTGNANEMGFASGGNAVQTGFARVGNVTESVFVPFDSLPMPCALLLFCGPYDVEKLAGGSGAMHFFLGRAAWAYFGTKDWAGEFAEQATISRHITKDFPPAFLTDGNRLSFEDHARELANALQNKGVLAETYFIPEGTEAKHEYQFIMHTPEGEASFARVVAFLGEVTGG